MKDIVKKHPIAAVLSVTLHVLLIGFFVFGMDFSEEKIQTAPPVNIVKATAIDDTKVQAEAKKLKNLELKKKLQEKKRLDDLKKKRLAEEKKIADLKNKQKQQKKKIAEQKAKEAARLAKIKKQQVIEKKKKAEVAKKKAEAAKKKAVADAKKRKERLAREKAEKIKAAKAKAAKEQAAREQALRDEAAQEKEQMRAQEAVASYTGLIRQKVERNWRQPPGNITGLSCVVRVRLIPGGDVVDAQVIKSSGNSFFDRSVELATRKAAPLPVPNDPNMFSYFRTLEFYFRPGG